MNLIVNHRMHKERNVVLQIYGRQETNTAVYKIMHKKKNNSLFNLSPASMQALRFKSRTCV